MESQIQILNSLTVRFHFLHTPGKLRDFVAASTRVTHTDPKAFFGAMAVTISAQLSSIGEPLHSEFLSLFSAAVPEPDASELKDLLERAVKSATANESAIDFAQSIGAKHGVSGYVYQTVPVEIHI